MSFVVLLPMGEVSGLRFASRSPSRVRCSDSNRVEIRVARPEKGPSTVIGRVAGSRVPVEAINVQVMMLSGLRW